MQTPAPRPPRPTVRGAGGPFVLILIVSIVVGFLAGQATIGFLVGLALALFATLLLWRGDRRNGDRR